MTRKICIISGKGGVGKTVVTTNLAAAIMGFSRNVIAVDTDIKMPGLGLQLGLYHFPVTINEVLRGKAKLIEAIYIHTSGIRFVPASLRMQEVGMSRLGKMLDNPSINDHIALVDTAPGMGKNTISVLKTCDEAIIVTAPELPAIVDVMKVANMARKHKCKILGIIVNKNRKGCEEQIRSEEIEAACGLNVLGVVPEHKNITKSIFYKTPEVIRNPKSDVSLEFNKIAANIIGFNYNKPKRSVLNIVRRMGK